MSYTPYTWSSGDTVTASRLNNIEQGVANAGGSDILYLIATGEVVYDAEEGFAAKTSYTATDLQNAFMLDTLKFVLAVFPYFNSVGGVTSYSYDDGAMSIVPVMNTSGTLLGITDQSLFIFTDDNDYVWIGSAPTI